MHHVNKLLTSRLTRFLLVGAGNTTINFMVLNFAYYGMHQDKIVSSVIATVCAFAFSFTFNRSFVFRDTAQPLRKFVRFTVVSVGGVLLIQTSTYALSVTVLQHVVANSFAVINLSNLIASFVVMFWNYHGYRLLVFNGNGSNTEGLGDGNTTEVEAEETA